MTRKTSTHHTMRKLLFSTLFICLMTTITWGQTTHGFNYQAIARNSAGDLIINSPIGVHISILQGSPNGAEVYSETQTVHTNNYGLFTFVIGSAPGFSSINWNQGPYFLHSQIDLSGGNNYTLETTQQLFSVPFALKADIADSLVGGVIKQEVDPIFTAWDKDYNDLTNRPVNVSTWINDVGYLTSYTETQILSISHDTIFLTGGSFVVLPAGFDGDYNHLTNKPTNISSFANDMGYITTFTETQILTMSHDTIFLTGGSYVVLPLISESQDLASVVGFGNSANNHQLKDVVDPTDPQDAVTLHYLDSVMNLLGFDSTHLGSFNSHTVDACDYYDWNGMHCTVGGTYLYAYTNLGGYYSVDTLHLTIRHGTHNVGYRTATNSYTWHDHLYTSSGVYLYNYINQMGCASTDTLKLTINTGSGAHCVSYRFESDTAMAVACGGLNWYGTVLTRNGVYEHNLGTIGYDGCDSIVKINLTIRPEFRSDTAIRTEDPISWRGNIYSQQGDYFDTLIDRNGCDSIYAMHLMIGGSRGIGGAPGLYSVSGSKQVRFAHGNLLYQSANNWWKLAEHQYDKYDVSCVSAFYRPWSDIFGWGTSGYHHAQDTLNKNYHPWDHSQTSAPLGSYEYQMNQYGYGPSHNMSDTNLVATSMNYDWGMYNPIINGGNGAGMWRTLTQDEWNYLFNSRSNASNLRSKGRVNNTNGYLILADNWTAPAGINFTPNAADYYINTYTLSQWETLEASGAVFLPDGFYWSSTSGNSGGAYCLNTAFTVPMIAIYNRSNQYHIRLAQDYQPGTRDCSCTYYDTTILSPGAFSWHGRTYAESGDYMEAVVNNAGCDSIISFSLLINESGQLDSLFSVSPSQRVYFSRGNLQYKTTHDIWRFAMYQFDILGADNTYISDTNSHWMDLYGWGTSGYHDSTDNLNTAYQPWSTSSASYYGPSPNMGEQNLVNESAQYDWGVHNPIANGGNQAGLWRTLTQDEWTYLMSSRPNASQLNRFCTIVGVYGLLILPDHWHLPAGFVWNADDDYDQNDWALLEASGAVFLPAAGYARYSDPPMSVGSIIYYWLSTADPYSSYAYHIYSTSTTYDRRYYRCAVRLVKNE